MNASPEQWVERIKAALAEDGYPDAEVWWDGDGPRCDLGETLPEAVWWRALAVAADGLVYADGGPACWPCWSSGNPKRDCTHDYRDEPWPEVERAR